MPALDAIESRGWAADKPSVLCGDGKFLSRDDFLTDEVGKTVIDTMDNGPVR